VQKRRPKKLGDGTRCWQKKSGTLCYLSVCYGFLALTRVVSRREVSDGTEASSHGPSAERTGKAGLSE
jgi:hypothetical protein